jgi:hypothetical protein
MTKTTSNVAKAKSTIQETRSPKVFAEPCPQEGCEGQGKIYAVAERCKVHPETGERTQRRYVKCGECGHTWGQDGPPASDQPTGEYVAGPCQEHESHGEGRIAVQKHIPPTAVCDTCGRQWQAIRKVE